jgi:hypothetical protein
MDGQELAGRQQLDRFCSDDFDARIFPLGPAQTVRDLIRRTPEFRAAKQALDAGLITERVVRDFTSDLMREFVAGRKFRFETALAALAALCESHFAPFAEELLVDLAALKLREIGHAIRVARECLQNRIKLPKTRSKTYTVSRARWRARSVFRQVDSTWKPKPPIQVQTYAIA